MKFTHFVIILACVITLQAAILHAFQPIIPPPNDYNMQNIKTNFDSIQAKTVTFASGNTTQTFDFPCETTSVIFSTVNTATARHLLSAVPIGNQVTVTLDGAAASDLTISIFTILNN